MRSGACRTTPAATATISAAERIGYRPVQNAEDYAAEILRQPNPLDPVAQRFQGGSFATMDYTPPEPRPRLSARKA